MNHPTKFVLALSMLVAGLLACSSDEGSGTPDSGDQDYDSGSVVNNSNNTSGGDDCNVAADCDFRRDFYLNPDDVRCRVVPQTGFRDCAECISDEECPEYYRCTTEGQFMCTPDFDKIDLNCDVDADCAYLEDLDYFTDFSRVSCRELQGGRVCAECLTDADCPGDAGCKISPRTYKYRCDAPDTPPDMGGLDAGDMGEPDMDSNDADIGD